MEKIPLLKLKVTYVEIKVLAGYDISENIRGCYPCRLFMEFVYNLKDDMTISPEQILTEAKQNYLNYLKEQLKD